MPKVCHVWGEMVSQHHLMSPENQSERCQATRNSSAHSRCEASPMDDLSGTKEPQQVLVRPVA
jgi:hypothetical protein